MKGSPEVIQPVKPSRTHFRLVDDTPSILTVRYQNRRWGVSLFLLLWLIGWTVGCVFLAFQVWAKREIHMLAFAIPFWTAWFGVAVILISMLFGSEEVSLDETSVTYVWRVPLYSRTRSIPLAEVHRFVASETKPTSSDDSPTQQIELVSLGNPILMFNSIPVDEMHWLAWRLNDQLRFFRPNESFESTETSSEAKPLKSIEIPSECSWVQEDEYEGVTFVQKGQMQIATVMGILFICLFWNGIVSVFVMTLLGIAPGGPKQFSAEWWGLLFFLIPFEVIGSLMILGLVVAILEPVRRTRWRIGRDEISRRNSWFGLGLSRRYDATRVKHVDLRIETDARVLNRLSFSHSLQTNASRFVRLMFVDGENTEVVSIWGITEGEGRWMLNCIQRDRRDWKTNITDNS